MATADRRLDVLRAIVSDYVATANRLSKSLAQRYDLGVSPRSVTTWRLLKAADLPAAPPRVGYRPCRIPHVRGPP